LIKGNADSDMCVGKADDLLRGDFVKIDRKGNKQLGDGKGRDVNGGCWVIARRRLLFGKKPRRLIKMFGTLGRIWSRAGVRRGGDGVGGG